MVKQMTDINGKLSDKENYWIGQWQVSTRIWYGSSSVCYEHQLQLRPVWNFFEMILFQKYLIYVT